MFWTHLATGCVFLKPIPILPAPILPPPYPPLDPPPLPPPSPRLLALLGGPAAEAHSEQLAPLLPTVLQLLESGGAILQSSVQSSGHQSSRHQSSSHHSSGLTAPAQIELLENGIGFVSAAASALPYHAVYPSKRHAVRTLRKLTNHRKRSLSHTRPFVPRSAFHTPVFPFVTPGFVALGRRVRQAAAHCLNEWYLSHGAA